MQNFSIKSLEKFSGIKRHTLRIWEYRYAILKPKRNKGNVRCYNLEEVRKILNIALLQRNGYKIAQLAKMSLLIIEQKITDLTTNENRQQITLNNLIISMFSADIEKFENVLDNCLIELGIDQTIQEVIIPFLEKIPILSYTDSSNEVHFAVTAIRKKIILGIETIEFSTNFDRTALLFLQQGEHYDLLLLYMTYVIKKGGFKVLYLGTNVSISNLKLILIEKRPDYLFTYIPPKQKFKYIEFIQYLHDYFPQSLLFIVGSVNLSALKETYPNIRFINYRDVLATLKNIC